jgi:hypothetical protein
MRGHDFWSHSIERCAGNADTFHVDFERFGLTGHDLPPASRVCGQTVLAG